MLGYGKLGYWLGAGIAVGAAAGVAHERLCAARFSEAVAERDFDEAERWARLQFVPHDLAPLAIAALLAFLLLKD